MPTYERFWIDDHQSILPIEQPRPEHERGAVGILHPVWLYVPLFIEGQLFPQEEDLSAQG
jgi:hypothetical protein